MSETVEWECPNCGERYPKRSPPCGRCGNMEFEQVAFEPDPEPTDTGFSRRGLVLRGVGTLAAVSAVTGVAAEFAGVTDRTSLGAGASAGAPLETPDILVANHITEYEQFGDVRENAVSSVPAGKRLAFGFRYRCGIHDGRLQVTETITLRDEAGTDLGRNSVTYDEPIDALEDGHDAGDGTLDDRSATSTFAHSFPLDTRSMSPGYTSTVTVRDDVTGEESAPASATIELR